MVNFNVTIERKLPRCEICQIETNLLHEKVINNRMKLVCKKCADPHSLKGVVKDVQRRVI